MTGLSVSEVTGAGAISHDDHRIEPAWLERLTAAADAEGLTIEPKGVLLHVSPLAFLEGVELLGGKVRATGDLAGWHLSWSRDPRDAERTQVVPTEAWGSALVRDFDGVLRIDALGGPYLVLRHSAPWGMAWVREAMILVGERVDRAVAFAERVRAAWERMQATKFRAFGTARQPEAPAAVEEGDVILPPTIKEDVLGYIARFWKGVDHLGQAAEGMSRGMLLVGQPGTGKTMIVRHLLHRYRDRRRVIFTPEVATRGDQSPFRVMLDHLDASPLPAMVVLEDVDRILESGTVTRELLLNSLDGVYRPRCPVLWVATSNDPTEMDGALLDRPGRFDRVVVIPAPALEERIALFRKFAPRVDDEECVQRLARAAEGLTGAHIREICADAILEVESTNESLSLAGVLGTQVERMVRQHRGARGYGRALVEQWTGYSVA